MTPFVIVASLAATIGLGWVGYKANARIAVWGRRMNEIDDIFHVAEGTADGQPTVRTIAAGETRPKTPFPAHPLPAGQPTLR